MNPYLEFVSGIEKNLEEAEGIRVSGESGTIMSDRKVLLFSPHPDDECINGLLPLRLMRETRQQIVNVPVTFGSKVERQAERATELEDACGYLGWDIHRGREDFGALDAEGAARILDMFQPELIFLPHAEDWNSRHISTHFLVMEALAGMPEGFSCLLAETEYWGAMDDPNLMVEGDAQIVADLVAATSLHAGEVARNPYHLLLPAWMQDNVRRGGELVCGQGEAAPDFSFAALYRIQQWQDGGLKKVLDGGTVLSMGASLDVLFQG
jgi:LmbE family N-acetylglucosaminyl deacetylase